jgi:hypothetical protein
LAWGQREIEFHEVEGIKKLLRLLSGGGKLQSENIVLVYITVA